MPTDDDDALRPPSLAGAGWLDRPDARRVMTALEDGGFAARIVGGAVRNALLGEPVRDLDIATAAPPADVMRLAAAAGLKTVPTGLDHGTVTVIAGHTPVEVTTLRRDIETFGRRARVTFTTDWTEDARRRDFTMNALYCDADGTVHDPLGGYEDLIGRRVRFIGDAGERIREDYLRILRFFRFTADYAAGPPDPAGLEAAVALREGLATLSPERIRAELMRLLAARRAVETAAVMNGAGLLEPILGGPADTGRLARLAAIETALAHAPDPILRLGALAVASPGSALALRDRLRLSNAEFERLARMAMPDKAFVLGGLLREAKAFLYRHGAEAFADGVLLAWAASGEGPGHLGYKTRLLLPARWKTPALPVRGSDVIDLGVAPGPAVSRIVSDFEEWWIENDFPSDPAQLATHLARLASPHVHPHAHDD